MQGLARRNPKAKEEDKPWMIMTLSRHSSEKRDM